MAKYTGKQSVADEALGDFKDYGFSLVESDDHLLLELWFKDNKIATYNREKATIEIIRTGCKNYMTNINKSYIAEKLQQDYLATYGEELKKNG